MTYEAGVQSNPRNSGYRFGAGVADARAQRLPQPLDVIGRAYEPRAVAGDTAAGRLVAALSALLQLVLPVILLMALGATALLYGDQPVTWLGSANARWLTLGHLIVPLTFFAIHLTNRRYGAGYALAQIVLAWLLGAAVLWSAIDDLSLLAGRPLPALNEIVGFGVALFLAHLFSVLVFDRTRGPRWWSAPFQASLWGGVVFCLIAFPAAYLGTSADWFGPMLTYAGILGAAALVLLVPYCALRSVVPPLSGFGGY